MNINKKNKSIQELESSLMFDKILKKVDKKTLTRINKLKKEIEKKVVKKDPK